MAWASLALLEAWSGRTKRAEDLAGEALATARDVGLLSHPAVADAYLAVTLTAERGEPHRAALSLREGSCGRKPTGGRNSLGSVI